MAKKSPKAAAAALTITADCERDKHGVGALPFVECDRHDGDEYAALSAPPAAQPDGRISDICLFTGAPEGWAHDAFGAPRTRYVRVSLDGSHCVMSPSEGDTYLADAKRFGDESEYVVADVYLSEREFDDLGEFDGF